jgi:CRISPR/Cas system-associated exonuclease Cas4 (RecB family)
MGGPVILESPCAEERLAQAAAFVAGRSERRVTVLGASTDAAGEVARRALGLSTKGGASFGWHRATLGSFAVELARAELASRGLVPVSGLAIEAVCARVVHDHRGKLQRLAPIEERPGLPRALARTVGELRLAGNPKLADGDLTKLVRAFEKALDKAGLADRAKTLEVATEIVAAHADLGALVFVDVPLRTRAEHDFVRALAKKASVVFVAVPTGDERAKALFSRALGKGAKVERHEPAITTPLARLQAGLFENRGYDAQDLADGDVVDVLSAPGESRESVEIVRRIVKEAHLGTPLDRIAVLLRAPAYAAHLEEALRRAKVPAYFARGMRRPDPAGRALLALLACAAEGLSARRFAEYLSLGEVPDEDASGAPPPALPAGDRVATPDEESLGAIMGEAAASLERATDDEEPKAPPIAEEDRAAAFGTLRAPRHWERLLVDAAVIGGAERWSARLTGLENELRKDLEAYEKKAEDGLAEVTKRDLAGLASLRKFALPLVEDLAALPRSATWSEWIDGLGKVATRAIRHPERVLAVLAELAPMGKVDRVDVTEVRLVLERRLSQLVVPSAGRRYGKVFVGTIDEARGLAFDVVFVPGLAEKIFPQKVVEDPLLLDEARQALDADLPTNRERSDEERLMLRLAVGAAARRVVLSYPRLDVEQARPRTPSFYGLEVLHVAEGRLPGFEYLQRKAGERADARIGWPAPSVREDAIDEAEYDLALLESILKKKEEDCVGEAHYLLTANEHLARALRFRGRRWLKTWKSVDGLVEPPPEALTALHAHSLASRSFSPTALQNFASCPYRFLLSAVHKLAPREEPSAIEDLDPLTRGSLVHEIQFELLTEFRKRGMLPVTTPRLEEARRVLDEVLHRVVAVEHDRLAPAIERVWSDAVEGIAADMREWLRIMTEGDEIGWTPTYFELSFGLKDRRAEDPISKDDPAELDVGIKLRGSIDLVEKHDDGRLRATDYKTGKVRAKEGETVIGGGETLQPVLYALVLEKLFPGTKVDSGRLYYCTAAGNFTRVPIPLTEEARSAAKLVAKTIGDAIQTGFLPAAPAKDACKYCDFRPVCGPYEEIRTKKKAQDKLKPLKELRKHR